MQALRIFYDKAILADGAIVEMTIWQLPRVTTERPQGLKYNLFYGRKGKRFGGYDNERGKGHHKHVHDMETRYRFINGEMMVADFLADVERVRNEQDE